MTDQFDLVQAMYEPPAAGTGVLSLADLDAMIAAMSAHADSWPERISIPVEIHRKTMRIIRTQRLYDAHPAPRYKIRKCHMRKLQARWRKGREHIRRVEQAERAREEAEIQRLREDQRG